jgi:hypothetical protein
MAKIEQVYNIGEIFRNGSSLDKSILIPMNERGYQLMKSIC